MKITGSQITMASSHYETSYSFRETLTMEAAASKDSGGVILSLSKEGTGKSYVESMKAFRKQEKEESAKKQQENEAQALQRMFDRIRTDKPDSYEVPEETDNKIKMLRRILAALRGEDIPEDAKIKSDGHSKIADLRSAKYRQLEGFTVNAESVTALQAGSLSIGTTGSGTLWQRVTATSGFAVEAESTTFASTGIVQTADGRSIDFNIEVSMTRAFMSSIDTLSVEEYIKTDPLVINLDTNVGSVSDQKFLFDLDSDGEEELVSFAGEGSGFLALDLNEDGNINDGSELFGTKSGDGFADLAKYDEDKNGWIDENDSIFNKLKVWTKDSDGRDCLIDLKRADVGAICLDNADTRFYLKDDDNRLNGEIRKTGIYLKESTGRVGTVNHIDLAV